MDSPILASGDDIDISLNHLTAWASTDVVLAPDLGPLAEEPISHWNESPFPVNDKINEKLYLWSGDLARLEVDALLNSTNESMLDRTGQAATVIKRGGQDLVLEIDRMESGCKTGETRVTGGHSLPANVIIHTVGPRYKENYRIAAENALHNSYRNALQECVEGGHRTIALSIVHLQRRGFPPENGAHIACRTVRRFLEKNISKFDGVVFVMPVEGQTMQDAYNKILPMYFPRNEDELKTVTALLPADIGNEDGETVVEERKIRIDPILAPVAVDKDTLITPEAIDKSVSSSFARMVGDTDDARMQRYASRPTQEREAEKEYWRYVAMARNEDLDDIAAHNFVYQSGVDSMGRPVLVVVAKSFPAERVGYDRILMYLVSTLDALVQREYAVVYLHSGAIDDNMPPLKWLLKAYNMFNWKYKKNLKALYVVHRSFWLRAAMWFMTPFVSSKFWRKVSYIDQIGNLFDHIDHSQIEIPPHVFRIDRELNGYTGNYAERGVRSHSEL